MGRQGRRPASEEMRLRRGRITSRQVSEQSGVPYPRIDYWTKVGFLKTTSHRGEKGHGKGSRRVFNEATIFDDLDDLIERMQACPYEHKTT